MNLREGVLRIFGAIFREQKTRLKIDWLTHTDELIMEQLAAAEQSTPAAIAAHTDRSPEYIADRCRQLALRGLLEEIEPGGSSDRAYRIADLGMRYLTGDVDAEELEDLAGDPE